MSPPTPDPLDTLLNLAAPCPDTRDLTADIWRRLSHSEEAGQSSQPKPTVQVWFTRWPFAALFIASCILTGLLLAEFRINHLERKNQAQLTRSYLVLIDPLLQELNQGSSS